MGQGESSQENQENVKQCYYELLEIEKTATDQEIEKAYKKAALKYHPDKNRDKDTTPLFQACQEAYSVLSDPHERQWYDDHRDQILRGVDPEKAKEEDSSYITPGDLIKFVNPSCYPGGFEPDSKHNFYEVYRELFKQIDKEEELEEDVGVDHNLAPTFGDAGTYIEDVLEFYKFWELFGTKKEFAYVDKYSTNQAKNGRERRYIQTENRRERQAEKKKFNQTVRDILEFVRKRDPRYQHWKKSLEEEKEKKKQEEAEKKRKAAEAHQKKLEEYREQMRKEYEEMEEQLEEEVVIENKILCEICNKTFKTEGAFKTHCSSKKHKQKMAKFAKISDESIQQKNEDKLQELDQKLREQQEQEEEEKQKEIHEQYVKEEEEAKRQKEMKKLQKKIKKQEQLGEGDQEGEGEDDQEGEESSSEEEYVSKNKLLKKKKEEAKLKKQKNKKGNTEEQKEPEQENKGKGGKNKKKKKKKQVYNNQVRNNDDNTENTSQTETTQKEDAEGDNEDEKEEEKGEQQPVEKKKRRRRAKKDKQNNEDEKKEKAPGNSETTCRICNLDLGSKNRLFKHLKKTGHAKAS